jgi:AcrR family transcriptional regulator
MVIKDHAMTEELSRRERKKIETRERLLASAWDLYRSKGFEATTVEEITNVADVAKGTFFNYFSSKEEKLGPLAVWRMEQLRDDIDVAKGAPSSALERIKLLLHNLTEDFFPSHDLARRTFFMLAYRSEQESPPLLLRRVFTELVREAQAQGELRDDVDPRLLSKILMVASLRDPRHLHTHEEQAAPQADMPRTLEILLEGLAGPQWRKK